MTGHLVILSHASITLHIYKLFVRHRAVNLIQLILSGILASLSLTSSGRTGAKGSFVGYSAGGLPLYNFTNSSLHQTSRSFFILVSSIMNKVLEDHNSRKIFYFLCLNLSKYRLHSYCG